MSTTNFHHSLNRLKIKSEDIDSAESKAEKVEHPLAPAASIEKSKESNLELVLKIKKPAIAITLLWDGLGCFITKHVDTKTAIPIFIKCNPIVESCEKPRSVQEVLAKVEPATVAVSVDGGVKTQAEVLEPVLLFHLME